MKSDKARTFSSQDIPIQPTSFGQFGTNVQQPPNFSLGAAQALFSGTEPSPVKKTPSKDSSPFEVSGNSINPENSTTVPPKKSATTKNVRKAPDSEDPSTYRGSESEDILPEIDITSSWTR